MQVLGTNKKKWVSSGSLQSNGRNKKHIQVLEEHVSSEAAISKLLESGIYLEIVRNKYCNIYYVYTYLSLVSNFVFVNFSV